MACDVRTIEAGLAANGFLKLDEKTTLACCCAALSAATATSTLAAAVANKIAALADEQLLLALCGALSLNSSGVSAATAEANAKSNGYDSIGPGVDGGLLSAIAYDIVTTMSADSLKNSAISQGYYALSVEQIWQCFVQLTRNATAQALMAEASVQKYEGLGTVELLRCILWLICNGGEAANLVPPNSHYDGTGHFSVNILAGVCYNVCWGANEVSMLLAVSGQTFQSTGAGTCVALWSSVDTVLTFTGVIAGTTVTASVTQCSCGICSPRPINFAFANNLVGGTTTATWNVPPAGVTATELWTSPDNVTYSKVATVNAPGTTATVNQPAAGAFLWGKIRHVSGTFFSSFTPAIEVSGLLNGLVSYWNLDNVIDNPGGAIDNFGSNNLINRVGGAGFIVLSTAGKINNAGDWHTNFANSPYLSIQVGPANLRLGGAASMTAAMWVKFINNGNNAGIFGMFGPAVNEYLLWFNTTPALEWNVRNGAGANVAQVIGNQTTGVYHLIVVGVDNANSQIFYSIDGGARVNAACVGTSQNGGAPTFELGNYSNGFPSDVNMDEVGWWNRVLNAAEIAFLYNSGAGKTLPL